MIHTKLLPNGALSPIRSRGMVTVTLSLVLLMMTTLITLFAAKTAVIETRVTANADREKQAFEAAEAGIEAGIIYLNSHQGAVLTSSIASYQDTSAITNITLSNGETFTVTYNTPTAGNYGVVTITSTGTSTDGQTQKTLSVQLGGISPLGAEPTAPLVAQDSIEISGSIDIINPEISYEPGTYLTGGHTVEAGGTVTLDGSAETTNGSDTLSTSTSGASGHGGLLSDVQENAGFPTDGDAFFQQYFSASKSDIIAYAQTPASSGTHAGSNQYDLEGASGLVYINDTDIDIHSNTTIGTPTEPVILIVEGDLKLSGSPTIYGLIYVIGDWDNHGGGTTDVNGSIIVQGNIERSLTGNLSVTYGAGILGEAKKNTGIYSKIPGSWKDF